VVDSCDLVTGFTEKGATTPGASALINAGIYVLAAKFARRIEASVASDFGHDVFPAALARGERLAVYRLTAPVIDVGVPHALELARRQHAIGKASDA